MAFSTGIAEAKDQEPGTRIITVNAEKPRTGADVVRRALPRASNRQRLTWTITAATVTDAIDECKLQIVKKWGEDPDHKADILQGCFVMLSCNGGTVAKQGLAHVVAELAQQYPKLTYVAMLGNMVLDDMRRMIIDLPEGADRRAEDFDFMLDDLLHEDRT